MIETNEKIKIGAATFLLGLVVCVYVLFDLFSAVSLIPLVNLIIGLLALEMGLFIFGFLPQRRRVVLSGLIVTAVIAISFINWNSRKPFLRAFNQIEVGMTADEVNGFMTEYIKFTSPEAVLTNDGSIQDGAISYRHTTEGWGDSDIGQVIFLDGRVVDHTFYPD